VQAVPVDPRPALGGGGVETGPDGIPLRPTLLRRLGAFAVDWVLCLLFTFLVLPYDLVLEPGRQPPTFLALPQSTWATLCVFAAYTVLLVSLTGGATVGHRVFGLRVWQVAPGSFVVRVVLRTLLVCLVVPAVVPSSNRRWWHDVVAGTRIVRR
jgi:uncharacterized RDD family membrane protein YckC